MAVHFNMGETHTSHKNELCFPPATNQRTQDRKHSSLCCFGKFVQQEFVPLIMRADSNRLLKPIFFMKKTQSPYFFNHTYYKLYYVPIYLTP